MRSEAKTVEDGDYPNVFPLRRWFFFSIFGISINSGSNAIDTRSKDEKAYSMK